MYASVIDLITSETFRLRQEIIRAVIVMCSPIVFSYMVLETVNEATILRHCSRQVFKDIGPFPPILVVK